LEGQKRGIGRIRYNASINRAIETRHKTLKHEMIDDKIKEGYSFGVERRKSKTGRIYRYLYRQKRNVHGKTKEHISLRAKNLDDYGDRVLLEQARKEVLNGFGGWADEGLTHFERKTFKILSEECLRNPKLDDRNPIAARQEYEKVRDKVIAFLITRKGNRGDLLSLEFLNFHLKLDDKYPPAYVVSRMVNEGILDAAVFYNKINNTLSATAGYRLKS
jgi:hypothetical protein